MLRPGGVNVMTSGHAIAHAERTPVDNSGRLNGVRSGRRCRIATGTASPRFSMCSRSRSSNSQVESCACFPATSIELRRRRCTSRI